MASRIIIDFETRSRCDLKACGMYRYAEDPTTEILCMGIKVDDAAGGVWVPPSYRHLWSGDLDDSVFKLLCDPANVWVAHNAGFERAIWRHVLGRLWKWSDIPLRQWRCTAAKAAARAMPRRLEDACHALGLSAEKDMVGHRLMLKWCKPRKPSKNNPSEWHSDPDEFRRLCEYCARDLDAEYALDQALPPLDDEEQEMWFLDQMINDRGVQVDQEAVKRLIAVVDEKTVKLVSGLERLTRGYVNSPAQTERMRTWLSTQHHVNLPNLQADTVKEALTDSKVTGEARRALEIRRDTSKAATKKFVAMKRAAGTDGRIRGMFMYHGASTGRWTGKHVQLHNFVRDTYSPEIVDALVSDPPIDADMMDLYCGDAIAGASRCLRGVLVAKPGYDLVCADYSAVEGRGLAWLANEQYVLENYRKGLDPYVVFASQLGKVDYDTIYAGYKSGDKVCTRMRHEGKTGELACGYQGWSGAVQAFAPDLDENTAANIAKAWREHRPMTVKFWYALENAAVTAIKTGKTQRVGRLYLGLRDGYLLMRLPSGRCLSWYSPRVTKSVRHGKAKDTIAYMGVHPKSGRWTLLATYGGKLAENATQAMCRDLLAEGMKRVEAAGYPVVMHVHDEAVSEIPEEFGSVEEYENLMVSPLPTWAEGLPLTANGWRAKRYQK